MGSFVLKRNSCPPTLPIHAKRSKHTPKVIRKRKRRVPRSNTFERIRSFIIQREQELSQSLNVFQQRLDLLTTQFSRNQENLRGAIDAINARLIEVQRNEQAIQARVSQDESNIHAIQAQLVSLTNAVTHLSTTTTTLSGQVTTLSTALENLSSTVSVIQSEVEPIVAPFRALIALLRARLGTTIGIDTDGGTITGTLVNVGTDFAEVLETTSARVFIPLSAINFIV